LKLRKKGKGPPVGSVRHEGPSARGSAGPLKKKSCESQKKKDTGGKWSRKNVEKGATLGVVANKCGVVEKNQRKKG